MKRSMVGAMLILVSVFCSALSVMTVMDIQAVWGDTAACSIDPATPADLSLLSQTYPDLAWTAYAQTAPQKIEHAQMSIRVDVAPVLTYMGDPNRIAFFPLMSGRLPMDSEQNLCAMNESTAYRLFGSANPIDASIRMNGAQMRVVGVLDLERALVLIPADAKQKLDRLVCDDRDALMLLVSALGIEPDPFEMSGAEVAKLLWLLCTAPWLCASAIVLFRYRKRRGASRIMSIILLLMLGLSAIMLALYCMPVRLLPSRWSDLSFYGKRIAEYAARPFRTPDIRDELRQSSLLRTALLCTSTYIAQSLGMAVCQQSNRNIH